MLLSPLRAVPSGPALLALVAACLLGPAARAQFRAPERLVEDAGEGHAVRVDRFGVLHAAYRAGGGLHLVSRGPDLDQVTPVAERAADPALELLPVGVRVAYTRAADDARRIATRSGLASRLGPPEELATASPSARRPALAIGPERRSHLAWEEDGPDGPRIVHRPPGGPSRVVAAGRWPALAVDDAGRTHLLFVRDGRLVHTTDAGDRPRGVLPPPEPVLEAVGSGEIGSPPRAGFIDGRELWVAYERGGELWLADDREGRLDARRLDGGGVRDPDLHLGPRGLIALAWERDGDIRAVLGNGLFLPEPATVAETAGRERSPRVAADGFANIFVVYARDDGLWWTTDAGPPRARFRVDPARGEAPLRVRFVDESTGDVVAWRWDFGDGATGSGPDPVHTYTSPGRFTVRLVVSGPAGESPLVHEETVTVISPRNRVHVGRARAIPGQSDVEVPVLARHDVPLQGFQLAAVFDPAHVRVTSARTAGSNAGTLEPELELYTVSNDPAEPWVTLGVLFDVHPPFDRRVLPPGERQRIANILVDVSPTAPPEGEARFSVRDGVGRPPIHNAFVVRADTVLPALGPPGGVRFADVGLPAPRFFVRGDANDDGEVTIGDAIAILDFLFVGSGSPVCPDAADTDDSGRIDITDALFALDFLFRAGSWIAAPHPRPGLDPTDDPMPDCVFR